MSLLIDTWLRRPMLLAGTLLLLAAMSVRAHGPFDNSSRLFLRPDAIEVVVTMGSEAAGQIISTAGLPEKVAAEALKTVAPSRPYKLPVETAARIFELTAQEKLVTAQKFSVLSDGLETVFTIEFPRPEAKAVELRAGFFSKVKSMNGGVFIAVDDEMHQLAAALLTDAAASVRVPLMVEKKTGSEGGR